MGKKLKLLEWVLIQRYRLSKGNCEFDFFKNSIIAMLGAQIYIKGWLGYELKWWIYISAFLSINFCFWCFGYWWDKRGLYHVENEIGNKRNKFVEQMRDRFHFER